MGLLNDRETTIRWDAEDQVARIWTNDPAMIKRMDTLCSHKSGAYVCVSRMGQSANYKAPAELISFRFPTSNELLEQQRKNALDRALHKTPQQPYRGSKRCRVKKGKGNGQQG